MDLGKINSEIGQKIISVAIFDDILALTILGVLLNIKDTDMELMSILKVSLTSLLKLSLFIVILVLAYKFIKNCPTVKIL